MTEADRMPNRSIPRRILGAGLLALVLVAPIFPLPTASAQLVPLHDLAVAQGDGIIIQGGKVTQFLVNGTARVNITVANRGTTAVSDVPVWIWAERPRAADPNAYEVVGGSFNCDRIRFEGATPAGPAYAYVNMTFAVPSATPPVGHRLIVEVNKGNPGYSGFSDPDCPAGALGARKQASTDLEDDNRVFLYFVKDAIIDYRIAAIHWCPGIVPPESPPTGCPSVGTGDPPYNRTRVPGTNAPTYFRLDVENVGNFSDTRNHTTVTNPPHFPYTVKWKVNGLRTPADEDLDRGLRVENGTGERWFSKDWMLDEKAGFYLVEAEVNPGGAMPERNLTNNRANRTIMVQFWEFNGTFGREFRSLPTSPYPYVDGTVIAGTVNFTNFGSLGRTNVPYTVYLDDPDRVVLTAASPEQITRIGPGQKYVESNISYAFSTNPSLPNYLTPGLHTLYAVIDAGNETYELNESNNVAQLDIYIADDTPPEFLLQPVITEGDAAATPITRTHPHKPFNVHVRVGDDDQANLRVRVNFTNVENTSISIVRDMALLEITPEPTDYYAQFDDFPLVGNGSSSNWTMTVEATNPFNRMALSGQRTLRVDKWPIHSAPADYLVLREPDGKVYPWKDPSGDLPTYIVRLHSNMTGRHGPEDTEEHPSKFQHNDSWNLAIEVKTPDNETHFFRGPEPWTRRTSCEGADDTGGGLVDPPDLGEEVEENLPCENIGEFSIALVKELGPPGTWNISIQIWDVVNVTPRYINRTLIIQDLPPFHDLTRLLDEDSVQRREYAAGETVTVHSRFTDDFRVKAAFANFTRKSDGAWVNFTYPETRDEPDGQGGVHQHYFLNVTTGRGGMLGLAGNFSGRFIAVDENNNWRVSPAQDLDIVDALRPSIYEAAADPALQEVRSNVTFRAKVEDESNVTLVLSVLSGSQFLLRDVNMSEDADGEFTYVTNFTDEANLQWQMLAVDGGGKRSETKTGTLLIRTNLGPRFEIRSPGAIIGPQRYAGAMPRFEILVYDSEGVERDSITMAIDGQNVTPDVLPAPAGTNGYILSLTTPAAQRYAHKERLVLNLTAVDLSSSRLPGFFEDDFVIDDVAPVARVESFAPRHRASDLHAWNVSRDTRFTLSATDDDELDTRVESIYYRIYGPTPSNAETLYSVPFKLTDAVGQDARPGLYQIQFFAKDSVDNVARTVQTLTVYLDDTPPAQDPFGPQPRERYVNMSFVDDKAGVARAVVWHRTNNGTYAPLAMEQRDGAWRAVLPEGKKGDRISYYLQVWDNVDNDLRIGAPDDPHATYVVPNHEPTVRILAPPIGDVRSRSFDITWEAFDQDGDALVFDLSLKAAGSAGFSEIARLETPGVRRFPFDSTKYPDGDYTLRVRATDGTRGTTSEVSFSIRNRATSIGEVAAARTHLEPGDTTLITAAVTKVQTLTVEARIMRDGEFYSAVALRDDGEGGDVAAGDRIYSALVTLADAGDYSIDILTKYREDGVEKDDEAKGIVAMSVDATPGYVFREYGWLIALIAVAALVALGVAGWALMRRR